MAQIELNKQELISLRKLLHCQIGGHLPSVTRKVDEAIESLKRYEESKNKSLF